MKQDIKKSRLRFFDSAAGQQHITDEDKYLYQQPVPSHKIAIIGTGTIGQEHMRVAALLGRAQVHGIYDTQTHSMDVAEANFKQCSDVPLVRYESLESACNDSTTDALFICTPNHTHFDILQVAIKSGKAIFLEKPMAIDLQDAAATVAMDQAHLTRRITRTTALMWKKRLSQNLGFHEAPAQW